MKLIALLLEWFLFLCAVLTPAIEYRRTGVLVRIDTNGYHAWRLRCDSEYGSISYDLAMPDKRSGEICQIEEIAKRLVGHKVHVFGVDASGGGAFPPGFYVRLIIEATANNWN